MLISFNIPTSTKTVTISLFKIKQRLFDLFYCEGFFFFNIIHHKILGNHYIILFYRQVIFFTGT